VSNKDDKEKTDNTHRLIQVLPRHEHVLYTPNVTVRGRGDRGLECDNILHVYLLPETTPYLSLGATLMLFLLVKRIFSFPHSEIVSAAKAI
jgi:hypothetical protein